MVPTNEETIKILIDSYANFAWLAYADVASGRGWTRLCCSALTEAFRLNRASVWGF
jgi:hypothetical protein